MKQQLKKLAYKVFSINDKRQFMLMFKRPIERWFYPKYDTPTLIANLKRLGLSEGKTVMIHSSWDRFSHYTGKPSDFIQAILQVLGPNGTLVMPAFPSNQMQQQIASDPKYIFDVRRTPSGAGFLTEIFRRYSNDVRRSINLNHSVCALGPYAEYLTKDHHLSVTSWDEFSPYYRLKETNALIINMGFGHRLEVATAFHCVESILRTELKYYHSLFPHTLTYTFKDYDGICRQHTMFKRIGSVNPRKMIKHMDLSKLQVTTCSNLKMCSIDAEYLINRAIELGRQGITMYVKPKPYKKLFVNVDEPAPQQHS
ncbi:AAC(3) family N-acetyltransferase [Paenibacillus sp. KN14-4R]|uniref:AAC(3) family N-acetyltransferase n=1 Tax=Paenibacillus sp. KN14-4R TaxID=3445773 RepID=UPI003FA127D0